MPILCFVARQLAAPLRVGLCALIFARVPAASGQELSELSLPPNGMNQKAEISQGAVLRAMGRDADADLVMDKAVAMPDAPVMGVHQYATSLIAAGRKEQALAIFKLNRQRHPEDTFVTYVGPCARLHRGRQHQRRHRELGNRHQEHSR
jgi:hypothetical protein